MWSYIMILLAIIAIAVGIITVYIVYKKKKEGALGEPNYFVFFIIGIFFLPLGPLSFVVDNPGMVGFTALGFCYIAIGLFHRDTWGKDKMRFKKR